DALILKPILEAHGHGELQIYNVAIVKFAAQGGERPRLLRVAQGFSIHLNGRVVTPLRNTELEIESDGLGGFDSERNAVTEGIIRFLGDGDGFPADLGGDFAWPVINCGKSAVLRAHPHAD